MFSVKKNRLFLFGVDFKLCKLADFFILKQQHYTLSWKTHKRTPLWVRTQETKVERDTFILSVEKYYRRFGGEGNIYQQLACSKENKQFAATSISLLCPFPVQKTGVVEVNQFYFCSRLEEFNSGPESAIFQRLSKNMCSRYGYSAQNSQFMIVFITAGHFCVLFLSVEDWESSPALIHMSKSWLIKKKRRRREIEKCSITSLTHQRISEWVPSEWESKINNPQVIHSTPVHQLTFCETKSCVTKKQIHH